MRATTLFLIALVAWTMGSGCEQAAPTSAHANSNPNSPAIFSRKSFDDAKKDAQAANKLLVVDATASWCGPCKRMDKTTWVASGVIAWMNEHSLAVQIDVDEDKPLAQLLKIRAMPTVIVFKDGQEVDRSVGYLTPEELLSWLNGALKKV